MTAIETGIASIRSTLGLLGDVWKRLGAWTTARMPKRLYARSLLIIVLPMVILQSVVAFVFMERHYNLVTRRLSATVTQDIAAIVELYEKYPQDAADIKKIAGEKQNLRVDFLPGVQLPPPAPKPFFSILDEVLSQEISKQIKRPFWIDTVGNSNLVEIRIQLDNTTLQVFAPRNQAYASNSHIFILWMVGTSLVLIFIAIIFLRNQIRPILRLAEVANAFGKGREIKDFRPRGAIEVRQAAFAFLEMKRRIERQIEQRTTMLAGVSHDLRTILTRFKLELAILEDNPDTIALRRDVDEMQRMLEAYLAFARGDVGEQPSLIDVSEMLQEFATNAERRGKRARASFSGPPIVQLRADAFKRCVGNLVANATRYGNTIEISGTREPRWLTIVIDDDGPGIPANKRDDVFRPFLRLDDARNQNEGGTGLGLAIARDIAGSHGGDILLAESPLGGLRATIRIPV
ncbi:MAG TPA: ATP-binding protein [Xanthobacteraceae bacterium]|nr:ATP-binding protein [Xanthobacteraceae bacterium]